MKAGKVIIILIPGFAASEADSTCIPFARLFVKNFASVASPVKIIVIPFQYPYTSLSYKLDDVSVIPLNGKNRGKISRLKTWIRAWSKFRQVNSEYEVAGILSFWMGECALVGNLLGRTYNLPAYTWIMGQDAKKRNIYQNLTRISNGSLIALSDSLSDEYANNYGRRPACTIPLGIDPGILSEFGETREIDLLAAGSLISLKNYDQFIRLVAELRKSRLTIHAMICGEGPVKQELIKMAEGFGIDNIKFLGEIPHNSLIKLMAKTKIFIHPSGYEGNSAACAEALYAGAHVVSYCQPMKQISAQHHVVKDFSELVEKTAELLSADPEHKNILDYPIIETCKQVYRLFSNNFPANA